MQGRDNRHYQNRDRDYHGGGDKRGRGGQQFGSPRKSGVAAPAKGPIVLITNNFRIRSRNHGIIHTYRVDFIEGHLAVSESQHDPNKPAANERLSDDQGSNISRGSLGALETF